uniref:Uncharacterized protein n=1 Tax=Ascaris lumbricoides TaxID=6252 RepID=A0A0M3IEB7_ASCLU
MPFVFLYVFEATKFMIDYLIYSKHNNDGNTRSAISILSLSENILTIRKSVKSISTIAIKAINENDFEKINKYNIILLKKC